MATPQKTPAAAQSAPSPASDPSDGRFDRSIKTRAKIVAAFIDLVGSGNPAPTAEQIAVHAKVGLRTVFRHFDDMETLEREITSSLDAVMMPLARLSTMDCCPNAAVRPCAIKRADTSLPPPMPAVTTRMGLTG